MYCMINNDIVNVTTFAAYYLGKVARAATRGISVGGLITQIAKHLRKVFNLEEDYLVEGKDKIDMDSLVHQGMIFVHSNTYTTMIQNKVILDFPNPRKVRVDVVKNWLYTEGTVALVALSMRKATPICLTIKQIPLWIRTLSHYLLILSKMKSRLQNKSG